MIKMIGSIFIIFSTSFFGYLMGREKINRLNQLKELKRSIFMLRGEIRYGMTPLPEAFENIGSKNETIFSPFFLEVSRQLKDYDGQSFYIIWKEVVKDKMKHTSLSKSDKEKLMAFGENLGYLDQEMQINTILLYLENLEEEIIEETSSGKEKIRLYQLLGVLSGVFVTIVMI